MAESLIPVEKNRDKPSHWPFEQWLLSVVGWLPHHIKGITFTRGKAAVW